MTTNPSDERPAISGQEPHGDQINLRSDSKPKVLSAVAQEHPCSIGELTSLCERTDITSLLKSRFSQEIEIDEEGTIQLTPNAIPHVVSGSRPHIQSAKQAIEDGKRHSSADEYDTAAKRFKHAVSLLEGIKSAFEAVSQKSTELDKSLKSAREYHETAVQRAASQVSLDPFSETSTVRNESQDIDDLQESALETSWESIPDNARLKEQLLVKVTGLRNPQGDRKSIVVELEDRHGKPFDLAVWETHDIDVNWTVGKWYALIDTRGKVWKGNGNVLSKRLSSTSDLQVLPFGPNKPAVGDPIITSAGSNNRPSGSQSDAPATTVNTPSDDPESDLESGPDEEGVLDEIMADFEEL